MGQVMAIEILVSQRVVVGDNLGTRWLRNDIWQSIGADHVSLSPAVAFDGATACVEKTLSDGTRLQQEYSLIYSGAGWPLERVEDCIANHFLSALFERELAIGSP